jgi:pimeloyl-ACP methyl ester carboxylesterase
MAEFVGVARSVDVLGGSLVLEWFEGGSGDSPVLLLHGMSGLDVGRPYLGALAGSRRVIAPMHPGYGDSERPDWLDSVGDLAHFYLELLEQLDLRDVTLIGHSLGGWIAAEMATWRRERLGRLVLVDSVGIRVGGRLERDVVDIFTVTWQERAALTFHFPESARRPLEEYSPVEIERYMRAEEATALYTWEPYMCDPKLRRRLAAIDIPTLVVWGREDGLVSEGYGRVFADAIPGSRFEVVSEAGHYPQIDQPERFGELVEAFIADTSQRSMSAAGR